MNGRWSLDARVLVGPASAFHAAVRRAGAPGLTTALRRPLFTSLVIGTVVSLLASGTASARFTLPATAYWSIVPLMEMVVLLLALVGVRARVPLTVIVDLYFAGHAPWTLLLIAIGAVLPAVPPALWWFLIIKVFPSAAAIVVLWSAYIDYTFFRQVAEARPGEALLKVVMVRALVWTFVFCLFAIATPTPSGILEETVEAVREIMR